MSTYPMSKIWKARKLILEGYSVEQVSQTLKMKKSSVYSYTKSERAKQKSKPSSKNKSQTYC